MARMSASLSIGLVGVSVQMALVFGRMAASSLAGGTRNVSSESPPSVYAVSSDALVAPSSVSRSMTEVRTSTTLEVSMVTSAVAARPLASPDHQTSPNNTGRPINISTRFTAPG